MNAEEVYECYLKALADDKGNGLLYLKSKENLGKWKAMNGKKIVAKFDTEEEVDRFIEENKKWVVKKPKTKTGHKIFDNEDDAKAFIKENRGKGYRRSIKKYRKKGNGFTKKQKEVLETLGNRFLTRWSNIDPVEYFDCSITLSSNNKYDFSNFLDPKIIKLYVRRDKEKKRSAVINKTNVTKSMLFIKKYIEKNDIRSFNLYCTMRKENRCLPVIHYFENKIDHFFLTWLIYTKQVKLTDDERTRIPYILDKWNDSVFEINNMKNFFNQVRGILDKWGMKK